MMLVGLDYRSLNLEGGVLERRKEDDWNKSRTVSVVESNDGDLRRVQLIVKLSQL